MCVCVRVCVHASKCMSCCYRLCPKVGLPSHVFCVCVCVQENVALAQRVEASQNRLRVASQERAYLLERLLEHQASGAQPRVRTRRKEKRTAGRKEQTAAAAAASGDHGGRSSQGVWFVCACVRATSGLCDVCVMCDV